MLTDAHTTLTLRHHCNVAPAGVRFLVILSCLCLFGASPALAQAEYSDGYSTDNSGYEYDEATDTLYAPDGAPHPEATGIGVAEDSYDSPTYSVTTYTTMTSPDGRTSSGYSEGYIYARAETVMVMNVETAAEGDYTVDSEHTYYREGNPCADPLMECYEVKASPDASRPLFARASYNPLPARTARPLRYFFTRLTSFRFGVRRVFSGYQRVETGLNPCPSHLPYTYLIYCPDVHNCRFPNRVCRPIATPFSQGIGLKFSFFFVSYCRVRFFHTYYTPTCS